MKPANHFFSSLKHPIFSSFLLFFFALVFFTILLSCNEHGTEPNKPPKDPFEMTWTADTIAYEGSMQTLMTSMWASSPTDVWIAGHNDRSLGEIFHYDGISWKEIDPMNEVPRSPKSINEISGLAENNIWMVGDRRGYSRKDLIINWDGTKWREHNLNLQIRPISLFANRSNDIWIGCDSAVVLHYDGVKWEKDKPKLNIPKGAEHFINGIIVKDNLVYLNITSYDNPGHRYVLFSVKGTMKNWTVIDSMEIKNPQSVIKWGNWGISLGKEGSIFSFGDFGVWELVNNNWLHTLPINYTMQNVFALNEKYKIAVGVYGMVWFNDGASWQQITKFFSPEGNITITDAWTDGQEIFLLGHTTRAWPQKTIVWRGK